MDHRASPRATRRRRRRLVLLNLAVLAAAIAAFVVLRPQPVATPSSAATGVGRPAGSTEQPGRSAGSPGEDGRHRGAPGEAGRGGAAGDDGHQGGTDTASDGVIDQADGVIPAWMRVSVFDDETPAVVRLDPALLTALRRAGADAANDGVELRVNSGWRSREYQEHLLREAVDEYGSLEEAARWVATADTSAHVSGDAADIGPSGATDWLSEHGAAYGLCQIYENEPWHYELVTGAAATGCPAMYANPTDDPRMGP